MALPENEQTVIPYLILKEADKFIAFAREVFGAKEISMYRTENNEVMHAEIKIGNSTIMIGESGSQWGVQTAGLFINVEDADVSFNRALENGATEVMPMDDKDYGRTGGVQDPCGNTWWITSEIKR